MYQLTLVILLVLSAGVTQAHAETAGFTLEDTFNAAVHKTESVPIQQSLTQQAEERYNQVNGSILPSVNLTATYLRQQVPASAASSGSISNSFAPDQKNVTLGLTQPLFRGFREFAGLRQAKYLLTSQENSAQSAKLTVFTNVAQAFYGVLAAEQDIRTLKSELDVLSKRVSELQIRVKIGRSRYGELLTAQSEVATILAQVDAARATLDQALETFTFVTGLPADTSLVDHRDNLPSSLPAMETFVSQLDQRPDLKAQQDLLKSSEENVNIAKGAHLPSLNLIADYYPVRAGFLQDVKWDVGLNLAFPIYQGGVIQSQVRQAAEIREQTDLQLSLARRSDQTQIETFYKATASGIQQVQYLQDAVAILDKTYNVDKRDYEHGLVQNLDVLTALSSLYDSQRNLDRTKYQVKFSYASLLAAVGKIPQAD